MKFLVNILGNILFSASSYLKNRLGVICKLQNCADLSSSVNLASIWLVTSVKSLNYYNPQVLTQLQRPPSLSNLAVGLEGIDRKSVV